MTLRLDLRRRTAIAAATSLVMAATGAKAQSTVQWEPDDWYYRQPPTSLPQQLNGVLRPLGREEMRATRIDNVRQVFAAISSCWRLARKEATGQQMTLRMSFKRSGEVLGKPRITYYEGTPGSAASRDFTDSVRAAFRACVPLPFTESFGAAVASRPFTFRFIDERRV